MKKLLLTLALLLVPTIALADAEPVPAGSADICIPIFVENSSTGAGLTGLAFNTASLVCQYYREGQGTGGTSITLATSTLGTHTDGAFKEIDSADMPGSYEFCPPDAAFAAGADWVLFECKGAASMREVAVKVPLTPFDGLLTSESGTTLGLASGAVDADDQFNVGVALVVFDASAGISATSCITDSTNSGDTVVTAENISALVAVNDRYILQPNAGCAAVRPTVAGRTLDLTAGGEVDAGVTGGGGDAVVSVD